MTGRTMYQKIVDAHLLKTLPDGRLVLRLDRVWAHEITTPTAILDMQARNCDVVFDPSRVKTMIDHVSPAKDSQSAIQGRIMRQWSARHGIEFADVGLNGICHALIPERGWVMPGDIGIMGDSHTCTHGAFGALSVGVGTTELGIGIMTGLLVLQPQRVIRVDINGFLPANVFAKDVILWLIKKIGAAGATNAVLEFGGSVIRQMSMDSRMTLTNMAVEAGATCGQIAVDEETLRYLWPVVSWNNSDRKLALQEFSQWNSDPSASYDERIQVDVTDMQPAITIGEKVDQVVPVEALVGTPVDQVFIGACTNGRIEDLRVAASVMKRAEDNGFRVPAGTRCIIVPATMNVWRQANHEGLHEIFTRVGCVVANPSCASCLGMSCGVLAPGEVCVSTSNRNFAGRMGKGGVVHLASPATAAATAMMGKITVAERFDDRFTREKPRYTAAPTGWLPSPKPPKPINYRELALKWQDQSRSFGGSVLYLPGDDINTDDIIPAQYLNEVEREVLGKHCLEGKLAPADHSMLVAKEFQVLVTEHNFGCGSSREHAPWALEGVRITCVIARSFARIFKTNMLARGLVCVELSKEDTDHLLETSPSKIEVLLGKQPQIRWQSEFKEFSAEFPITDFERRLIKVGGSTGVMLGIAAGLQQEGKI